MSLAEELIDQAIHEDLQKTLDDIASSEGAALKKVGKKWRITTSGLMTSRVERKLLAKGLNYSAVKGGFEVKEK